MTDTAENDAAQCFSCGRQSTHRSPNGRVYLCDQHVRSLSGTGAYLRVTSPEGWVPFGALIEHPGPVEFSEETDEAGMPLRERVLSPVVGDTDE